MARLANLVVLARAFQRRHQRRKQEIGGSEHEVDIRMRVQRVAHAIQRFILTPFCRHAGHYFDPLRIFRHRVLESVAASHGVDVAQIADQHHRLVPPARLLCLLGDVTNGCLGKLVIVRHHRRRLERACRGRAVVDHDRNPRLVRRADHGDDRGGVLRCDQDAVHAAGDESVDLLQLAVRVVVGHSLNHLDPAAVQFRPYRFETRHPVLGLQRLESHADPQPPVVASAPGEDCQQHGGARPSPSDLGLSGYRVELPARHRAYSGQLPVDAA